MQKNKYLPPNPAYQRTTKPKEEQLRTKIKWNQRTIFSKSLNITWKVLLIIPIIYFAVRITPEPYNIELFTFLLVGGVLTFVGSIVNFACYDIFKNN